jgi:nucleotidyltransferase/DNA polymerase involved in DNA repair
MKEQYYIDLEKYDLQKFKKSIQNRDMIPSRVILKEKIEERFQLLKSIGIENLKDLIDELKTKQNIEVFSKKSTLSIEYLTILNREAKSYLPSPIPLKKFTGINTGDILKLEEIGIKNSKQLFNKAKTKDEIKRLSEVTGIAIERIKELVSLSDLSRLYGVGPVFARMIYDVGIKSVKVFIKHSPAEFIEIYENETRKKADFGVNDIKFSIELAKELET